MDEQPNSFDALGICWGFCRMANTDREFVLKTSEYLEKRLEVYKSMEELQGDRIGKETARKIRERTMECQNMLSALKKLLWEDPEDEEIFRETLDTVFSTENCKLDLFL